MAVFDIASYGALPDGSDSLSAINDAISDIVTAGGGELLIPGPGAYRISGTVSLQTPTAKVPLVVTFGPGASLEPNGNFAALLVNQDNSQSFGADGIQPKCVIRGAKVKPQTLGQGIGIEIRDSWGVVVRDSQFEQLATGVLLNSVSSWSEGWQLEDVLIDRCTDGLEFRKTGGTGSFQSGNANGLFIREGHVGVRVGVGAALAGSRFDGLQIWPGLGAWDAGVYMAGDGFGSHWQGIIDGLGTPTGTRLALNMAGTATNLNKWQFSMNFIGNFAGGNQQGGAVQASVSWTYRPAPY